MSETCVLLFNKIATAKNPRCTHQHSECVGTIALLKMVRSLLKRLNTQRFVQVFILSNKQQQQRRLRQQRKRNLCVQTQVVVEVFDGAKGV